MPSRKRHRQTSSTPTAATPPTDAERASSASAGLVDDDVLRRFNEGLRQTEQRKHDERQRKRQNESAANQLADAQARLDRAIAAIKRARQNGGKAAAEADAEWKAAKAEVLFLETGERPAWAPVEADPGPTGTSADEDSAGG